MQNHSCQRKVTLWVFCEVRQPLLPRYAFFSPPSCGSTGVCPVGTKRFPPGAFCSPRQQHAPSVYVWQRVIVLCIVPLRVLLHYSHVRKVLVGKVVSLCNGCPCFIFLSSEVCTDDENRLGWTEIIVLFYHDIFCYTHSSSVTTARTTTLWSEWQCPCKLVTMVAASLSP